MTAMTPQPAALKPLTQAEIVRLAAQRVNNSLAAERAPVNSARQAAAARSAANAAALTGLGAAHADLVGNIGQGIQQGYSDAASQLSGLAGGFSAAAADRVRAAQAANDAFVQQQAAGSAPSTAPSGSDVQDPLYAMQGFIPGGSLVTQGAAARRYAETLPSIVAGQTTNALGAEQYRAATEDQGYAQKLIDIAATQPQLKNQALDALYQHELEKLNARLAISGQNETKREFDKNLAHQNARDKVADSQWTNEFIQKTLESNRNFNLSADQWTQQLLKDGWEHDLALRGMTVQEAAQKLYERQFSEVTVPKTKADIAAQKAQTDIAYKTLALDQTKYDYAILQAANQGRQIDPAASKVLGYVVDQYNRPVVGEDGKTIPVAVTATSSDQKTMYQKSVDKAVGLLGSPVANPIAGNLGGLKAGKYIAAKPSGPGVIPAGPGTGSVASTNDPRVAKRDGTMTFAEAQAYLMDSYGQTRANARKALIAAGWKPDGIRPAGK